MYDHHDPWIEAAHSYSRLDAHGRLHYWTSLGAEQQAALVAALSRQVEPAPVRPAPVRPGPDPRPAGMLSLLLAGCSGFVLGGIGTVILAVVLVVSEVRSEVASAMPGLADAADADWEQLTWWHHEETIPQYCLDDVPVGQYEVETCRQWKRRLAEGDD